MAKKTVKLADNLPEWEMKYVIQCPKCEYQREVATWDVDNKKYAGCKCKRRINIRKNMFATTIIKRHIGLE